MVRGWSGAEEEEAGSSLLNAEQVKAVFVGDQVDGQAQMAEAAGA